MKRTESTHVEIKNRKAFHDYDIGETFEAGIVLCGSEVKSIKLGHAQIKEAFIRSDRKGQIVLFNAQIDEYYFNHSEPLNPTRQRYLLLHKKEIRKIRNAIEIEGLSAVPLKIYITHGLVKVLLGIGKGKKMYDKRQDLRKKAELRESERYIVNRYR